MRFMIMHKTDARWEAGEVPRPELIKMIGEMTQARRTARGRRGLFCPVDLRSRAAVKHAL